MIEQTVSVSVAGTQLEDPEVAAHLEMVASPSRGRVTFRMVIGELGDANVSAVTVDVKRAELTVVRAVLSECLRGWVGGVDFAREFPTPRVGALSMTGHTAELFMFTTHDPGDGAVRIGLDLVVPPRTNTPSASMTMAPDAARQLLEGVDAALELIPPAQA